MKEDVAAAFKAKMQAEADNDWDHLPEDQEIECFRRQVHMAWHGPEEHVVQAHIDRFVELAMEIIYERAWDLGRATGYVQAMKEAAEKVKEST